MRDFIIVTDSACDLSNDIAKSLDLEVLPLKVVIEGVEYPDYLDHRSMSPEDFYDRVRKGMMPSTAQVNVQEYLDVCEKLIKAQKDILILTFSSALSGTYNSARLAVEQLQETYPTFKIMLVDTLAASLGEGLIVYKAGQMRKQGYSIEQVRDEVEKTKLKVAHWFTVSDINHLKRGGRISSTAAVVANLLNINPILHVSDEGKLIARTKVIGRKKALHALFNKMKETYNPLLHKTVFISHGDDLDAANMLKNMILDELDCDVELINFIGPVIGAHSGPNTIALFFYATSR
ncbi:DegV family protein [Paracholeplasma manati]|uniref:DegV family protein n=1 Tax=Paracholeplasma manati TaxID=591373 RepID=UPI0024081A46|nr:DegV family protein [Paracholeplasma manati]MDG0888895.1 DegV family protein [Paracholeplasma manati]